ncbi:MAG: hypothetical protein WC319_01320 [Candidatus Paceibacterota bacterium]|jgi:hypothetical protein
MMTEAIAKTDEGLSRNEFFDEQVENARREQRKAFRKGWFVLICVLFVEFFFFPRWGIFSLILEAVIFSAIFFLVMYFVWGPADIGWASFPREGYTKPLLSGNELSGFIGCPKGKAFTEEWDVVDADHPDATERKDIVILGMHIIPSWPFSKVYWEKTEWERYYPNLKKALPRRELLKEFTLLPYPYYIEIMDAEDLNRLGVTLITNVVMEIVNPKKALFRQATTWIDIIKPIIQGGYVTYVKGTTFQEMLTKKKDIGGELLQYMEDPSGQYDTLAEMIEKVYGIRIESISVLDIVGSDKDEQDAIKAKAIAGLKREASLIDADAKSRGSAIATMGKAFKMMTQMMAQVKITEEEQQAEYVAAENRLKIRLRDDPKGFEEDYGVIFKKCLDLVQRDMALEKDSFLDVRSPDSKGTGTADLLSILATSDMLNNRSLRGAQKVIRVKEEDNEG